MGGFPTAGDATPARGLGLERRHLDATAVRRMHLSCHAPEARGPGLRRKTGRLRFNVLNADPEF